MKYKLIYIFIFAIFVIIIGGIFFLNTNTVNMEFVKEGKIIFKYNNTDIAHDLSKQELSFLKRIFNGKKLYVDSPSCGFTENISIKFNDSQTFCLARDTCPLIYWKEEDKFFKLTEEEKIQLYNLLETYGFYFPCV